MSTAEFITWLKSRSEADWEYIEAAARSLEVGGWRWEQAWEGAREGHELAAVAMDTARSCGAGRLAGAAVAGAMAALALGTGIADEDAQVLGAPLRGFYPPPQEPAPGSRRKPDILRVAIAT